MSSLGAAWQTLQENGERMVVKVLAGQASSILSQARAAAWLPEMPPKGSAPVSPYISEILQYLEVLPHPWLSEGSALLALCSPLHLREPVIFPP